MIIINIRQIIDFGVFIDFPLFFDIIKIRYNINFFINNEDLFTSFEG